MSACSCAWPGCIYVRTAACGTAWRLGLPPAQSAGLSLLIMAASTWRARCGAWAEWNSGLASKCGGWVCVAKMAP